MENQANIKSEKITFENIHLIGKNVEESTVRNGNQIIPCTVFVVEDKVFRQVNPTWLTEGYLAEISHPDEQQYYLELAILN